MRELTLIETATVSGGLEIPNMDECEGAEYLVPGYVNCFDTPFGPVITHPESEMPGTFDVPPGVDIDNVA
jgi:hypothetical protein